LPTRRPPETPTPTPPLLSPEAYYERGLEEQRLGDVDDARRYFSWAIQRDPAFASAYVSRGSLDLAEGDLEQALQDAEQALDRERTAHAYLLRGEVLRAMEQYDQALEAFDAALQVDPRLANATFRARWMVARAIEDEGRLSGLAAEYAAAHPDDALRHYYRAWAALEATDEEEVIALLVDGIQDAQDSPALLWYLLGRAYMGIDAWREAIVSLETARHLVQSGDTSLEVHTEQPVVDLFIALGRAYLGAGRCVDAETMLAYGMSAGATTAEHLEALEEARICQTPTPPSGPTATPGGS
jgi:tetratricopeptide (TPR) repeat protein